jgi:hypothetical protein
MYYKRIFHSFDLKDFYQRACIGEHEDLSFTTQIVIPQLLHLVV